MNSSPKERKINVKNMITAQKFIQQYRVARLIMIVIIVGLTIFLYTSYYANQTIQRLPSAQRLQMSSLISVSAALDDSIDPFIQNTVIGSLANQNLVTNENGGDESIGGTHENSNAVAIQSSSNDQGTQQQNIGGNNISELSNSLNENNENSNSRKSNIDKSDSNKIIQQNTAGECVNFTNSAKYTIDFLFIN